MRSARRIATVLGAGAAILLGGATAAYAGTDAVSSRPGVTVNFISYGDKFKVCDTSLDGYNVYADYTYVRIDGSYQTGTHYLSTGNNTCKTYDHDFGEGRIVNFRACVDRAILPDDCDDWRVGIA